jgi:tripartite-type tricarboxylate transporter receptor subunit TctC
MAAPDVREKNRLADYAATDMDPKQSAQWLKEKREHWAHVVHQAGIMMQ